LSAPWFTYWSSGGARLVDGLMRYDDNYPLRAAYRRAKQRKKKKQPPRPADAEAVGKWETLKNVFRLGPHALPPT
jgi:hypothetical protein